MAESLPQFFLENFQAHRNDRAYRQRHGYRTESFTYGQVLGMARSFAADLSHRGIVKGDRVMLWGENSAGWVAAFFGCVLAGVIVVPMDDAASSDFAVRVFRQVQAKLLVGSRKHIQEFAGIEPSAPTEDLQSLENRRSAIESAPEVAVTRDDVLQIVFTSGTTADPKGVVITHGNVLANIAPLEREMQPYLKYERLVHPLRFLNLLPLSHVFGQFLGMFLPPLLGGTVIFLDELKPSEIIRTIRHDRVSVMVSVPRVLQSLKQKIERDIADRGESEWFGRKFVSSKERHFLRRWWIFRRIRRQFGWKFWAFISGGAALDWATEQFWDRLGYAVIQGYGLTETTSLISVNHPFKLGKGSIGKVLPGREVKLAEDGEILVRGGGVASGYWDGQGEHRVADSQGWYRTGDVGALDDAGNLYFKGRKKEVIVTPGGTNVYPEDLEAALRRQPEVKDCLVLGIERGGNAEPCAVVILRDHAPVKEVVERANESLAEYQRMRMWFEWPQEDFPRTSTQKPRTNVVAEIVREHFNETSPPYQNQVGWATQDQREWGTLGRRNDAGPLSELISRISGRAASNLNENASLGSDLGLSSLDRVELLSAVEDRYQIDLSEARFSSVRTLGDLERMLRGEAAPGAGYHYPTWVLRWPIRWLRLAAYYLLMRPAIILLGWPRIEGRQHLRGVKGPLLVISNHIGDVDPGFILTALPARFRHHLAIATGGEALEALRTPASDRNGFLRMYDRMQWVLGISLLNLFPLPREAGFRRSFAYAGEAVDHGYSVLVFPEGHHTTDGKIRTFRAGIGLLAQNLGIPVLPMRIDGLFEVKQAGKKFVPPWKIQVKIGTPITVEPDTDTEKIAGELQKAVEDL
jgi:long-chain acyl-CoA synthetase